MPGLTITRFKTGDLGPLDFSIAAGECLALTAASGAGKTRLLRAIADLDPHEGEACLDGRPCAAMPAPEWRRGVAYLPAEPRWWHATVGEHFADAGDPPAAAVVERLGLPGSVWSWPVERLSSGETQRLALARLLERAPQALLLDEPTAHLDDHYAEVVESIVAEHRKAHGTPVLWVTHDVEQAKRVGTQWLALVNGKLEGAR